MSLLILVRHGKSLWNVENRFTGWTDISLSNDGIKEAEMAALEILDNKINISNAYSSIFNRAIKTGEIILNKSNHEFVKLEKDWRLNERHYGDLQGLNKDETAAKFGKEKVFQWRRSFKTKPPLLEKKDQQKQLENPLFKNIPKDRIPLGESLEETVKRVKEFCNEILFNKLEEEKNILIAAHGNSIRALIKIIKNMSEKETEKLEIQTGKPIIFKYKNKVFTKFK